MLSLARRVAAVAGVQHETACAVLLGQAAPAPIVQRVASALRTVQGGTLLCHGMQPRVERLTTACG